MPQDDFTPNTLCSWRVAWMGWLGLAFLGLAVMLAPAFVPIVLAQSPTPIPAVRISDDQVNAIAKEMYCPVCESTPLDVCPTQACTEWRELIRQMLAKGQNEAQIKDYFVNRFGPQVLAAPPPEGINWMVYIIPPVIILAGAALLYGAFRTWRRAAPLAPQQPDGESPAAVQDEYVRRLEEELRKQ